MLDFEVDICEKCGVVGLINRINEDFHFPCICHSPNHFLTHFLCNSCLQTFKPNPKESHDVIVSIDTFNIFLKAHPKYWKMFNHNIKIEFEKVYYKIDDATNSPEIIITCTYDTLIYLGKIYQQWIHDQTEDEISD